ncbi:ABC-three component system middle component 4 [Halopseudomonas pelagia]|uniref:ABC-three component system middle component 4 n=1 Tax=Halopseudomonas pelagia TaxID=553151 RepID=UPI0003B6AD3A|nr:ABC-three component system middle component 4 [Halopseudomonas pelagia]
MISSLPYLPIDEELDLNTAILVLLLSKMALNNRGNLVLDFEKIQIFLYLIKSPAKIGKILRLADKPSAPLDKKLTHTIESMSSNVDMLFNRHKIKLLIRRLAALGFLKCEGIAQSKSTRYALTHIGNDFASSLISETADRNYFNSLVEIISKLEPLQSKPTTKLNAWLNTLLKGN